MHCVLVDRSWSADVSSKGVQGLAHGTGPPLLHLSADTSNGLMGIS